MTVAPVLILLLSALLTWLTRNRHSRTQWVVASVLGFGVWVFVLLLNPDRSSVLDLSIWQPEDLFQSPISLTIDAITWPLIYSTTTVLLAVILTAATRPAAAQAGLRSFWFFYTALAVVALMSANLLTVVIAWSMIDFATLLFLLSIAEEMRDLWAIFIRAGINAVSVLLLVAAAIAAEIQGVIQLDLGTTSAVGIMMLATAATFRLGLIPLHFALPPIAPMRRGVGTLLRLYPPIIALALLARVFTSELPQALRIVFFIAGATGGLLGALRWVLQIETVQARPFFVLSLASLGLLVATLVGEGSQVIVSVGVLLLLIGAVLSLFSQHTPSHRVIPILLSLLLLGLPFTPGNMYSAAVASPEIFLAAPVLSLIALVITALLAVGCFHLFFTPETAWATGESLARVMFNVGLVLPVLAAIGVGVWRLRADPLSAGIYSSLAALLAALFFVAFRRLSFDRVQQVRQTFQRFEPDRIYELVWSSFQRLLVGLRGFGELLEGSSGMLWLFVFIIFALFVIQ